MKIEVGLVEYTINQEKNFFLYPITRNEKGRKAFKNGKWNKARIEAVGNSIKTWVNGIQCTNLIDPLSKNGFIALQIHNISQESSVGKMVKWKNIRILTKDITKHLSVSEDYAPEINNIDNVLSATEQTNTQVRTNRDWEKMKGRAVS